MGRPLRIEIFSDNEVCIVHVVSRTCRRAFICGVDESTGRDYSHRRDWIQRRQEALCSVFAIDVLTYAILSNHFHTVLRNRPDIVATWSDHEVATRWLKVYPGRRINEQLADPTETDVQALVNDTEKLEEIRRRLSDISWFMRALNEPIARMANAEDDCTGRFWEGRFKAHRIVDDAGLLACAMYVDLNPIRAAMAQTIEESQHTSAFDRLEASQGVEMNSAAFDLVTLSPEEAGKSHKEKTVDQQKAERRRKGRDVRRQTERRVLRDAWLAPLTLDPEVLSTNPQAHTDGLRASDKGFLRMPWEDYLELLRWTARGPDGDGSKASAKLEGILERLGIDGHMWRDLVWNFKRYFGSGSCAGSPASMATHAKDTGKRWHRGQNQVRACFLGS